MDSPTLYFEEDSKKLSLNNITATTENHNDLDSLDPSLELSFDLNALIEASQTNTHTVTTPSQLFPEGVLLPETSLDLSGAEQATSTSQMPVVHIIPTSVKGTTGAVKEEVVEVPLEGLLGGVIESASQPEDFNTVELNEITSTAAESSQLSGRPGRRPAPGKAPSKGRKRALDKDSDEYRARRDRNNVAVRKSRDKAKIKQAETEQRVQDLTTENERLNKKCDLLQKELNVLKGLFANVGAALPKEFKEFMARQ